MHAIDLSEVILFVPFIAILAFTMFRLDEIFSRPSAQVPSHPKLASGLAPDGMPIFVEPDGRPLGHAAR